MCVNTSLHFIDAWIFTWLIWGGEWKFSVLWCGRQLPNTLPTCNFCFGGDLEFEREANENQMGLFVFIHGWLVLNLFLCCRVCLTTSYSTEVRDHVSLFCLREPHNVLFWREEKKWKVPGFTSFVAITVVKAEVHCFWSLVPGTETQTPRGPGR